MGHGTPYTTGLLAISDNDDVGLCVLSWKGLPDVPLGAKLKKTGYNMKLFSCKMKKINKHT